MITPIVVWIISIIWGIIGAVFHQIHESEEENTFESYERAIFIGAVAGALVPAVFPWLWTMSLSSLLGWYGLIATAGSAGYEGDSFILNAFRKKLKGELKSQNLKNILREVLDEIVRRGGKGVEKKLINEVENTVVKDAGKVLNKEVGSVIDKSIKNPVPPEQQKKS